MRYLLPLLVLITLSIWTVSVSLVSASHRGVVTRTPSRAIVLGSMSYYAPEGRGWGTVKPKLIFNGGDPAGLVTRIRWRHWGQPSAIGWGVTSIFKPGGGYYGRLVRAELRATDIGRCTARGPRAYRRLSIRVPSHPGGQLRPWTPWVTGDICKSP